MHMVFTVQEVDGWESLTNQTMATVWLHSYLLTMVTSKIGYIQHPQQQVGTCFLNNVLYVLPSIGCKEGSSQLLDSATTDVLL